MMLPLGLWLARIGFLPVSIWDAVDIAIVSWLLYQLYKLVRGSIAFNIFIGVVTLYGLWFLVRLLNMEMLSALLSQFVSVGVIIIIIIFQPEIRRFLLLLGSTALERRGQFLTRLLRMGQSGVVDQGRREVEVQAVKRAIMRMSRDRTGALMVYTSNPENENVSMRGVRLNADISTELLLTIFDRHTPLHDGALLLSGGKVYSAGVVLPVTDRSDLPSSLGLRHRAAVGLSERSQASAFVVSEESGAISVAKGGNLLRRLNETRLEEELRKAVT